MSTRRRGPPSHSIRARCQPHPGGRLVQLGLGERAVLRLPLVQGDAKEFIAEPVDRIQWLRYCLVSSDQTMSTSIAARGLPAW